MKSYSLTHLSNGELLETLREKVALGRRGTAEVVALIAETEKRRLYAPAGFASMFVYCVEKLGFSEDEAHRRIQAARVARRFPVILELVADGRLHLTGVRLLKPYLTPATANSLLRALARSALCADPAAPRMCVIRRVRSAPVELAPESRFT